MNFASIVAQHESAPLRGATIGPYFRVVSRFDLLPLQGASLRGVRFPGFQPISAKVMRGASMGEWSLSRNLALMIIALS